MKALMIAMMLALAAPVSAGPSLEPFVGYTHVSDVFVGPPLFPAPVGCEQTTDWVGAGLTIAWGKSEFDIAHGVKARDYWCGKPWRQPTESGTLLSYRWYPLRKHR